MFPNRPPSVRDALRTLLIVLLVALAVLTLAYGWRTTNINLKETQNDNRQTQLTRAMRELLSPDIFVQNTTSEMARYHVRMDCTQDPFIAFVSGPAPQDERDSGQPYLKLSTDCASRDMRITIEGFNFRYDPRNSGILRWRMSENQSQPLERFEVRQDGTFSQTITVPRFRAEPNEIDTIEAQNYWPQQAPEKWFSNWIVPKYKDWFKSWLFRLPPKLPGDAPWPSWWPQLSPTTILVFDKMRETIFLALMATILSIPFSVVLSFLGARNLMKQVTMPLGNVLVGVVLLPVGWLLGNYLLSPIGRAGIEIGKDSPVLDPLGALAILGVVAFGYGFINRQLQQFNKDSQVALGQSLTKAVSSLLGNSLFLAVAIFCLGILGGVGIWLGSWLDGRTILIDMSNVADMLGTLGELVELLNGLIAGLAGAVTLAMIGSTLSLPILKHLNGPLSYGVAAVLGAISGALLMGILAALSLEGALLGVLIPIVAAVLGSQILVAAYYLITDADHQRRKLRLDTNYSEQTLRSALAIIGALAVFIFTFYYMNVPRALFDGRRPLVENTDFLGITMPLHVLRGIILGAILGGLNSGLIGTHASFPLGMAVYNTTRTILNATRSIEPLIMGIVFVIWVGIGPFAGMLALALHSVASLGKLYSEQVENIEPGPIEAIQATGANRLQTIVYAVVPQIVPPYIAFTMYRWDINVRMSTIIGFVGGGGIGFILQQQINLLRYEQAGVAVLAIAIVVSILDYASAWIREKMI